MDSSSEPCPTTDAVNTVIIGGGQAGLAMSRCLLDWNIDHVILERGRIGERWRSSYWDSLNLLTPNWQSRLPGGYSYQGEDVDGFMTCIEFVEYLEAYAESFRAPIQTNVIVVGVEEIEYDNPSGTRFFVTAQDGSVWRARNLVIASGYCDLPRIPPFASQLPAFVQQISASEYKNPPQIVQSGEADKKQVILVVGAGASGIQIAQELAEATTEDNNSQIVISAGRHCRWPRCYRGKDILWWMDRMGVFQAQACQQDETTSPGPQLIGGKDHTDASLYHLRQKGVKIVGKVTQMTKDRIEFDNQNLAATLQLADDSFIQILQRIDSFATQKQLNSINTLGLTPPPNNHEDLCPRLHYSNVSTMDSIDLKDASTTVCVIWATGFDRRYTFLSKSLLEQLWDADRSILRNQGGIVADKPGLYVLGYRWLRTKGSNFIDGVGADAQELAQHLASGAKG